jgi:hypothetical protein
LPEEKVRFSQFIASTSRALASAIASVLCAAHIRKQPSTLRLAAGGAMSETSDTSDICNPCGTSMRRLAAAISVAVLLDAMLVSSAGAHVKWFCGYDLAGQPRGLENVICPDFELLTAISVLALLIGSLVERSTFGAAMVRSLDWMTHRLHDNTELLFRAGCGFFFVAIWAVGNILLTPELKLDSTLIGAIQLGVAAGMLSRRTMPLSAFGIATLFAVATWQYGLFHLADYPIFLGVAAYLALAGMQRDLLGVRPIDVVRWSAGVTLMWGSVEKWAYPEWSFPLLVDHPAMTLGFDREFFMRAAGAVEFALAFALMCTPLVRRIAAAILAGMFISATFEFGKTDIIGHTLIVVVMLAVVADSGRRPALVRHPWLVPIGYASALSSFLAVYYAGHSMLFGT